MAIEDEKTRPVRAVKRKTASADVVTRQVKAVKRKAVDPFAGFLSLTRALVLKRGNLLNEAGEEDNGWVFREPRSRRGDPVSFVMRAEPLLTTLSRFLVDQGHDFDVMCAGEYAASLHVVNERRHDGKAQLLGPDGALLAELRVKKRYQVECFDEAGRSMLKVVEEHPTQFSLMVGRRSIGRLLRVVQPGILLDSYELELDFDGSATGLERLCAAAALVTNEAWDLMKSRQSHRDTNSLMSLFGD